MGFRFWRRVQIIPGVTLNLSKSGPSLSFGPRGAKYTIGPSGQRVTAGIPGTGLFYTQKVSKSSGQRQRAASHQPERKLSPGFFQRLAMSREEEAFVDGLRELNEGERRLALEKFTGAAASIADAAWFAGFLALETGDYVQASGFLEKALNNSKTLGAHLKKYGLDPVVTLPITDEISVDVHADETGAVLGLVEAAQLLGQYEKAITLLEKLLDFVPDDLVLKLSLAELIIENKNDRESLTRLLQLIGDIPNDTAVHTGLFYYKGVALHRLGLMTAAQAILTQGLQRKSGRSTDLMLAIRYERALVYMESGQRSRARSDFEKIYSEAPDYEDVASRLGL
jgi:tetratricopeptide (TPR) repeat protein